MTQKLYPEYPPALTSERKEYLLKNIKDWSIANGLAVRPSAGFVGHEGDRHGVLATTAPVTLFPSLFPRSCFEAALAIQKLYNELYATITCDSKWLSAIVEEYVIPSLAESLLVFTIYITVSPLDRRQIVKYAASRRYQQVLLTATLRLLEIDDFVARLWKIHLAIEKEGYAQVCSKTRSH